MGSRKRAAVVVLGDVGRSPRMQYHALSLADQAGMDVDLVGYGGSAPHRAVLENPSIHLHLLGPAFGSKMPRILYLLLLPLKLALQILALVKVLCFSIPRPDIYLVQNPPSIPVLTVVLFACWLRCSRLIIDWHNFGYTLLGLRLGPSHPLVKIHRWYERRYGRRGDAHLCVTHAMQQELRANWSITATVLYDRPPRFFRKASLVEKHELFKRLGPDLAMPTWHQHQVPGLPDGESAAPRGPHRDWLEPHMDEAQSQGSQEETLLTRGHTGGAPGSVELREDRPAVVVSSTSWSADEDFGILLEAAVMYDRRVAALQGEPDDEEQGPSPKSEQQQQQHVLTASAPASSQLGSRASGAASQFPNILFIVTGKGPLRQHWETKMAALRLRRVAFRTLWLAAEDYPLLLGSADLGVSLHTSSSGLDLPMKVVDMFGCSLPVCALAYSCIGELVKEKVNGLLFTSSSELATELVDLFRGFPSQPGQPQPGLLALLAAGTAAAAASSRWTDEWHQNVLPLLQGLVSKK